ncbi:UDP-glucuronosyltransferase 2A3-like [Galleria mellonella]|uniref:UDP-glucuronosyltransferase 2A3-like n=1 Tax=Galleria mellonella TaxID=7137 RepID=A0ABM3MMY8_GALME|nr:UDP-glucuronosyltransferase 2A3-like [Galleria mellonella]
MDLYSKLSSNMEAIVDFFNSRMEQMERSIQKQQTSKPSQPNFQTLTRHSNVKLFITQGGIHSTHEAIAAEVPLVAIPILGDQFYNVEKCTCHKIGEVINIQTATVELFKKIIEVVLKDESYRHNIGNLRKWLSDQPQPSLERAVWWTEHVL